MLLGVRHNRDLGVSPQSTSCAAYPLDGRLARLASVSTIADIFGSDQRVVEIRTYSK